MKWLKSVNRLLLAGLGWTVFSAAGFAQGTLVDVNPHSGILYCDNKSAGMLCTDDAGVTWHEIEYFRGRYRKAVMLSGGKATSVTIKVPAPEPTQVKKPVEPVPGTHEVVLSVQIDGRPAGDFVRLVQGEDGKFYVSADTIAQWRLQVFHGRSMTFNGQTYFALDALNGVKAQLDPKSQTLSLTVDPSTYAPTTFNASFREAVEATRPQPGLFLNHQLVYTRVPGTSRAVTTLGGLFEAGFFSPLGVLTSSFAERDFETAIHPIRLETKLAREFPDRMALLTVGDSISAPNSWSRQVTFAGISYGSDFATRPSFIPVVLPNLSGQAARPSTVDIYVNGVRTSQQRVDPGPFTINNIPVISGQGDVQMVVTDVLGRQQVVTQSYISAQELLRSGVNAYTYEAGILRRNFGIVSSEYSSLFAVAQHRHGVTDSLTLDGRVEGSGREQAGSFGAEYGIAPLGIIGGGVAASHSDLGAGGLAYVLLQRRARQLGYSGTLQIASSNFQQLGMAVGERAPKLQGEFQVSQSFGRRASVAVGYLRLENRSSLNNTVPTRPDFAGISSSINVRVGPRMYLAAAANLSETFKHASSATLTLVVLLGRRDIATATSTMQDGGSHLTTVDYTHQVPVGTGYGYHLRSDIGDQSTQRRVSGDVTVQTNSGRFQAEASEVGSEVSTRFTETGGIVGLGGHVVTSPWLTSSFALVDVPDMSGVRVFANNQYIARTGRRGLVVLPVLAPYVKNIVRLDDQGVPVDVGLDLGDVSVVPMSRTGVFLRFPTVHANGATFQLITEKNDPVPNGAEVTVGDWGTVYTVALRGEVFVSNISFPAHLHVRWADQRCEVSVESAKTRDPLPHIGPVVCKVTR
jgi:outer membrane usher protein